MGHIGSKLESCQSQPTNPRNISKDYTQEALVLDSTCQSIQGHAFQILRSVATVWFPLGGGPEGRGSGGGLFKTFLYPPPKHLWVNSTEIYCYHQNHELKPVPPFPEFKAKEGGGSEKKSLRRGVSMYAPRLSASCAWVWATRMWRQMCSKSFQTSKKITMYDVLLHGGVRRAVWTWKPVVGAWQGRYSPAAQFLPHNSAAAHSIIAVICRWMENKKK
eukprot:1162072-Pelagomonas_calceolata.AAC.2